MRKGLGRAVLFLQENNAAPYRDVILRAATEDLRYELQVESLRSQYAVDLMRASGEPEFYRGAVLKALAQPAEGQDEDLMVEVAALLAEGGDSGARQAVYEAYERHREDDTGIGVEEITRVDGAAGLIRALRESTGMDWEREDWFLSEIIEEILEARMGKEEAWRALEAGAQADVRVAEALEHVRAARREVTSRRAKPPPRAKRPAVRYEDLAALVTTDAVARRYLFRSWGRDASDEDLQRAAHALLAESDPARKRALLWVFAKRPYPLDPAPIIALAGSDDWESARAALIALENLRHPAVRTYALRAIHDPRRASHAVDMLNENFEEGDHVLIEWLAEQPEAEQDEEHWRDMGIEDFVRDHPDPAGARILTLIYEKQLCGSCRYWIVKSLMDMGALPDALREECRYDSYPDTRFLAEHGRPPND